MKLLIVPVGTLASELPITLWGVLLLPSLAILVIALLRNLEIHEVLWLNISVQHQAASLMVFGRRWGSAAAPFTTLENPLMIS